MNAATLAHALRATRSGRQWKCRCVAHEDSDPSMIIFDGREGVQVRCLANVCTPLEIIAELKRRGLWTASVTGCRSELPIASHETAMRGRARALFDNALMPHGSPAQHYLCSREIWSVAKDVEDIRFSMMCPREDRLQPALIVAMRHVVTGSIQAVQRIFVTQGMHGRVVKDGKPMMLGPVRDCAMMLGAYSVRQDNGQNNDNDNAELHIAEGLETALSVMAMDQGPVWAMGSCGAIERLAVLESVRRLVIWADHDAPGQRAADACADRWADAGRDVLIRTPNREGWDFADVWMARNARQ